jgi:molybdopterin molybdotransferase
MTLLAKRLTTRLTITSIRRGADGGLEAAKFPRDGAGFLSSLVETDGLVELPESVTAVEVGQIVAFLPYSLLL